MNPETIEKMIADGRDSAEARLAVGQARLKAGEHELAAEHLEMAVVLRPDYTAAWQALGTVHRETGRDDAAREAWQNGLEAARRAGDKQAEKVMGVFLARLDKEG